MTREQLVDRLRRLCELDGTSATARRLGFSISYVSRAKRGQSPISDALAGAMGYERVERFRAAPRVERERAD